MPPKITWGLYYWPIGLLVVSTMFVAPEMFALFTNPANTLSTYSQWELGLFTPTGVSIHTLGWWASIFAWVFFVIVITQHIWFRKIYFP